MTRCACLRKSRPLLGGLLHIHESLDAAERGRIASALRPGREPRRILESSLLPSPLVEVRNSTLHGRGVFAKRYIRKGFDVFMCTGVLMSTDASQTNVCRRMTWTMDRGPVACCMCSFTHPSRFLNHSDTPNCRMVWLCGGRLPVLKVSRGIRAGEELTLAYL